MPRLRAPCGQAQRSGPGDLDDARLFELTSHQSHRRPPDPEHLRQELLGQRKDVSVDPIPGLEQPACQAGFHGVEGIARRRLLNLRQEDFIVARH